MQPVKPVTTRTLRRRAQRERERAQPGIVDAVERVRTRRALAQGMPRAVREAVDEVTEMRTEETSPLKIRTSGSGELAENEDEAPDSLKQKQPALARGAGKLEQELAALYLDLGMYVSLVNMADGRIIQFQSGACAANMVKVASHHPSMMRALKRIVKANAYIELAMAHAGIIVGIGINHNRIPAYVGERWLRQWGVDPQQVAEAQAAAGAFPQAGEMLTSQQSQSQAQQTQQATSQPGTPGSFSAPVPGLGSTSSSTPGSSPSSHSELEHLAALNGIPMHVLEQAAARYPNNPAQAGEYIRQAVQQDRKQRAQQERNRDHASR